MKKFTFILFVFLGMALSLSAQKEEPLMVVVLDEVKFVKNEGTNSYEKAKSESYCLYVFIDKIIFYDFKGNEKMLFEYRFSKDMLFLGYDKGRAINIDFKNEVVYCNIEGRPINMYKIDVKATIELSKELKIIN